MTTQFRISVQGRDLDKIMLSSKDPILGLGKVLPKLGMPSGLGICLVSRLPGDMGIRLGDVVAEFLHAEHEAGRLQF